MKIIKFPGYLKVDPALPPHLGGNPVFHAGKRYESVTAMREDMTPLEHSRCFNWAFRDGVDWSAVDRHLALLGTEDSGAA